MSALTHNRVKNRYGPIRYSIWYGPGSYGAALGYPTGFSKVYGKNGLGTLHRPGRNLFRGNGKIPQTRKRALTTGTVGSSLAAKRAWSKRSRYTNNSQTVGARPCSSATPPSICPPLIYGGQKCP